MDAFSKFHPAVNMFFFLVVIACGMLFQHPAYIVVSVFGAGTYYCLLHREKSLKRIAVMLPFVLLMTAINPLFNTQGELVLFHIFGRPYTFEALIYGAALSGAFLTMMLWIGCYNVVMTSDKFTSLFGNLIPSISLLLVMVFRMIPNLIRKTTQITGARKSIGKGAGNNAGYREKLDSGMTVLSAMTSWALEGSLVTADSMRARGYGAAKRQSFMIYQFGSKDKVLFAIQTVLFALVITAAILGQTSASFTPHLSIAPVSWGVLPYATIIFIPIVLHIKEAIEWHISRSKI